MRKIVIFFIVFTVLTNAQDCPTRIGLFQINYTSIEDLSYHLPISKNNLRVIDTYERFILNKKDRNDSSNNYNRFEIYEIKPDLNNIKSYYNTEIASVNDSTKVIFIPTYKVEDITVNNILLKFYNDRLYYISASVNQQYTDIILEKYRGKAYNYEEEKSPNNCKLQEFKKHENILAKYFFASKENKIRATLIFDMKINENCKMEINDKIEIYDFDVFINELQKINVNLDKLESKEAERIKREKEEILNKF